MSGDVQPRKRRDKKKKKDEPEETVPHQHFARAATPPTNNDDVNIHIYKETSTGGGICAKFVFFILLGALAVLIGLIITEHRGLTDLDTIESETRFSQYFEGWVDKTPDSHDDHDVHVEESHEHEEEDHDEHDEHDEHEDEEHASEEEEHASEEDEHASEEQDATEEDHEEDEDELVSEEAASQEDEVVASDEDDHDTQEDDDDEQDQSVQEDSAQDDDDVADEEEDQSTAQASEEEEDQSAAQDSQEEENDDEKTESGGVDEDSQHDEQDEDEGPVSTETPASDEKQDDEDVSTETVVVGDEEAEAGDEGTEEAEEGELTNTEVAVKFGVGVAILVVAYVVLVRKWKSDKLNEEKNVKIQEVSIDLSRRNTIVVPPKVEEVEQQVVDNDDEDYSEEEVEEVVKLHPKVKQDYQQLRSTYERSLTPESDPNKYDDEEYEEDEEIEDEQEVEEEEEEEDEEDEEDDEDEQVSDVDDEDLMKKFEAKYGKLETKPINEPEDEDVEDEYDEEEDEEDEDEHYQWKRPTPSAPQSYDSDDDKNAWLSGNSGAQAVYEFENITNTDDYQIRDQLDNAQQHINNNAALAVALFNKILESRPKSPRALYGKARSLDNLADTQRSNELLKDSVENYLQVVRLATTPAVLFVQAAERCINRLRFIGHYGRAVSVHKLLVDKFPDGVNYRNQLAVTYLTVNRISEARQLLQETLNIWPNNGFALVHYGFILKVNDNKLEKSVEFLRRGIASKEDGVVDGRFYFHLGDALTRLGKHNEATEVFKDGVANKVFLSLYQRSLYNVNRLTSRPWWKKEQIAKYTSFYKLLENNYHVIRNEGLAVLNEKGFFQDEAENLRDVGDWKQFELFARGIKNKDNCKKCPATCKILESFPDSYGCRRGQIKFSVMHPGTHVWPHCGPTNCRLRVHLGLKVPPKTFIRVADEIRSWEEGKVLIFDDSFEHEVWHNGSEFRLVLIADVWHPELTVREKQSLSAI